MVAPTLTASVTARVLNTVVVLEQIIVVMAALLYMVLEVAAAVETVTHQTPTEAPVMEEGQAVPILLAEGALEVQAVAPQGLLAMLQPSGAEKAEAAVTEAVAQIMVPMEEQVETQVEAVALVVGQITHHPTQEQVA